MAFGNFLTGLFGSANDRVLRSLAPLVQRVAALEPEVQKLSPTQLKERTAALRKQSQNGTALDSLLPEVFALVRETALRVLQQRHFDVQIIGGIALHRGHIAEMKTGEGKTLVATLSAVLNALSAKGVHIVTVNDYLAVRDAEWMGQIYQTLGLTTGCIRAEMDDETRREQYLADITYGTNNEFGFDFLRDNLKMRAEDCVQRPFNYAIVDEVDCILIDEARTPLIISGPAQHNPEIYSKVDRLVGKLEPNHFERDEKQRTITLTDAGAERCEALVVEHSLIGQGSLYDLHNIILVHHITQALKARHLFGKDKDYIVRERRVVIIDEFTGRMMEGRRYSDGLHQALEAKEGVPVQSENQTLASITFQNYFRNYPKLAGMTGTAMTEAAEFNEIYGLDVIAVQTHKPMRRNDSQDDIYRTSAERDKAVLELIQECHQNKQPVLIGTVSVEKSEALSERLKRAKIPHRVLNARRHQYEAEIIAQAGKAASVTIATNMAGRGTDIQLGGNPKQSQPQTKDEEQSRLEAERVRKVGGLFICGTERHESRRIDNQLRGRAGRQGDPGDSKFFLSLEDDLMRIFGSKRLDSMLKKLGIAEGEAISHPWVSKAIEKAQKKVEEQNFEVRKQLLKFDDVTNDQRKIVFAQRRAFMSDQPQGALLEDFRSELLEGAVARAVPERALHEQWHIEGLHEEVLRLFALDLPIQSWADEEGADETTLKKKISGAIEQKTEEKKTLYSDSLMAAAERALLLQVQDSLWKDHLSQLDHLRQGIGLRSYGQQDPLNAYRKEAFAMFEGMLWRMKEQTIELLSRVEFDFQPQTQKKTSNPTSPQHSTKQREKIRRNAPCPCESGRKYKHCCGRVQ